MKLQQPIPQYIVVLFLLTFLTGCSTSVAPATVPGTILPTIGISASPIVAPTPVRVTPTLNQVPLTVTPSPTFTPLPPTRTPVPTLTIDQEKAFVIKMLKSNGGCELPCWWGITPGKTAWQAARELFVSQGINWSHGNELHFDPPLSERSVRYRVDLYLVQRAGVVESVEVHGEVLGDPRSNHFARDWQLYSLDHVLTRYGVPSQVRLSLMPATEPGAIVRYGVTVAYDQLGFVIHYEGPATDAKAKVRACPALEQVAFIVLQLQSPKPGTPILGPIAPEEKPFVHTLEEATGMSLETFHTTFKSANNRACLDLSSAGP